MSSILLECRDVKRCDRDSERNEVGIVGSLSLGSRILRAWSARFYEQAVAWL